MLPGVEMHTDSMVLCKHHTIELITHGARCFEACVWPGQHVMLFEECLLLLIRKHSLHAGAQLSGLQHWPVPNIRCNTLLYNPHLQYALLHHNLSIIPKSPFDVMSYLHNLLDLIYICKATGHTHSESQLACKICDKSLALQVSCVSWVLLLSVHLMGT